MRTIARLRPLARLARPFALLPVLALAGCSETWRLFHPRGPVAAAAWRFTLIDVAVMMIIILPVTVMICVFMWRYRKARNAAYDPDWSHSMTIEFLVWGAPLVIVALLAFFSYQSVVQVNPYGPTVLNAPKGAPPAPAPLKIDVITTDWQWIFVYPEQHIATIDDLVVPAGRNVELRMTSTSVVNDFYIPQIAPMMDIMPGMRTQDAFRADHVGTWSGFSANFSGAGFAWMQFATRAVSGDAFKQWVLSVQQGQGADNRGALDYAAFQKLAHPTINLGAKPAYFATVDPDLFDKVVMAAMQGVTYPVPGDLTEKMAPKAGPLTSPAAGS